MNPNVTVTYRLSQAGQKAAILAGRNASQTVTEQMELGSNSLDALTIESDGSMTLKAIVNDPQDWPPERWVNFDVPPSSLGDVIAGIEQLRTTIAAKNQARADEQKARREKEKREQEEKAAADFQIVESVLAGFEAAGLLEEPPVRVIHTYGETVFFDGTLRIVTQEQLARLKARQAVRAEAAQVEAKRIEDEKTAAREAMIAEYGGIRWAVAGGMCEFAGQELWRAAQSRRWVGIFTAPKGISEFLDSPKGEFIWDVSGLKPGDCIQGAGFDTNYAGKRKRESEWFGVVRLNAGDAIVVELVDSRAGAFAAAAKIAA